MESSANRRELDVAEGEAGRARGAKERGRAPYLGQVAVVVGVEALEGFLHFLLFWGHRRHGG